jgi:pilus assembly protein CpaB
MIKNLAIGSGSNRTLLLLALLLGLVSAVLIGVYLSNLEGDDSTPAATATAPVVVAAQDIPALTRITPEMLTVKSVPVDLAVATAFKDVDDAVGQLAQSQIAAGEQITQARLTSPGTSQEAFGEDRPLSLTIAEGMRGFTVAVSSMAAAGGLVRPGDHVDLILSSDPVTTPEQGTLTSGSACYVMQNITVLAMDAQVTQTTDESTAAGIAATDLAPDASRATVQVTPEQAWQLAAVQKAVSGGGVEKQLWVSLRPFGDTTVSTDLPTCQTIPGS